MPIHRNSRAFASRSGIILDLQKHGIIVRGVQERIRTEREDTDVLTSSLMLTKQELKS